MAVGIFAVLNRSFSGKPGSHASVAPGGVVGLPPGLGGSLIIASGVGPQSELYRYDLTTATVADLGPGAYPSVSPDGQRISFRAGYREHGLTAQQIAVMNIDGSGRRVLSIPPGYTNDVGGGAGPAVWSPDGTRLAFAGRAGIYTARPDGSDLQLVTAATEMGRVCADEQPAWSPIGQRLVFAVSCEGGDRGLWSVVVSSGSQQSLVAPGQEGIIAAYRPAWSPDGATLAFEGFAQLKVPHRRTSNIFLRDVSGGLAQLTHCVNTICRSPAWSSDGRWVAFSRQSSVSGANPPAQLGVIRSDGSESSTLVRNLPADISALAWVPALLRSPAPTTPAETSTPSAMSLTSTVLIDTVIGTRFDPPPTGTPPLLTAQEAIARFETVDHAFHLSPDATVQLGLFTAPRGDGTYRFDHRLAYGIRYHFCNPAFGEHVSVAPSPGPCIFWLFLDANTGKMLEGESQIG
jgi:Tol biopolymer transport system component